MRFYSALLFSFLIFILSSGCSAPDEKELNPPIKEQATQPPVDSIIEERIKFDSIANKEQKSGLLGVFDVPEMLSMTILDSSKVEEVRAKRVEDYTTIEREAHTIGAKVEGSPGIIYYSDDPTNFVFECVILIHQLPKQKPAKSKLVALEASKMVIYNFFGSYQDLNKAYSEIRTYCSENNWMQSGPMREFYITNPTHTQDPRKWLTRIMVPVTKKS